MAHILKNKELEIHIDLPFENYNSPRFDWTGKIVHVKFQDIEITGLESTDPEKKPHGGKGFYNEFGIESPPGFSEALAGGWFHKIGIGLLKKEGDQYLFHKEYAIKPCAFKTHPEPDKILLTCKSEEVLGYSYLLKKEIQLLESGFSIHYFLQNTGKKSIVTNEYNHNFIAIGNDLTGANYRLKFPFQIKPERFSKTVNPEGKVDIGPGEIKFTGTPEKQFFFSNLTGGEPVNAGWEIINSKHKTGIRETGSYLTNNVNLWGWKHVISPELFFIIVLHPGQTIKWSRTYTLYRTG